MNAASGETRVQRRPAIAFAARLPKLWTAARRPKAEPRRSAGARVATAACSAVSTQPMATPEDEPDKDQGDARAGRRQQQIRDAEQKSATRQHTHRSAPVAQVARGDARERLGEVVARVEHESDPGGKSRAATRREAPSPSGSGGSRRCCRTRTRRPRASIRRDGPAEPDERAAGSAGPRAAGGAAGAGSRRSSRRRSPARLALTSGRSRDGEAGRDPGGQRTPRGPAVAGRSPRRSRLLAIERNPRHAWPLCGQGT